MDSFFGLPEIKLGTIPGAGGSQRLTRGLGKHKAMELILLGQTISGAELAQHGLVNKVFSSCDAMLLETKQIAAQIAGFSQPVVQIAKQAVLRAENSHLDGGMATEKLLYYGSFSFEDFKIGTQCFVEKKQPVFKH
ncbi:ClpP/crotonase-like domain-containing protein, partial [Xylariomycetidae sp. FL2044]